MVFIHCVNKKITPPHRIIFSVFPSCRRDSAHRKTHWRDDLCLARASPSCMALRAGSLVLPRPSGHLRGAYSAPPGASVVSSHSRGAAAPTFLPTCAIRPIRPTNPTRSSLQPPPRIHSNIRKNVRMFSRIISTPPPPTTRKFILTFLRMTEHLPAPSPATPLRP